MPPVSSDRPRRPAVRTFEPRPSRDIDALLAIMAALRDPNDGCAWDIQQTFDTIAPYTLEEAYEVADAIARGDLADLRDELGDLLLQVVFHARMAEERGAFDFGGVVEAITAKLIRRHPHVFGDARDLAPAEVKRLWDEIKQAEKRERVARHGDGSKPASILDGVPPAMPSLTRADKLTRKAAKVGFEWPDLDGVTAKVEEELAEVREAVAAGDKAELAAEVGDLLFTVANLARHLDVDPEAALASANRKFERRFRAVEQALAAKGRSPEQSDLAEMDRLWDEAKAAERAGRLDSR
jgi:ATP diphosphatase